MSSNIMSTEPGGQSDQYEDSLKGINKPPAKQTGTLGSISAPDDSDSQLAKEKREKGEKTVNKILYGQKLSEEGMGGQTDGLQQSGADQGGYGNVEPQGDDIEASSSRKEQGYGPGSGVGA